DDTEKPESDKAKKEPTNADPISTVKPTKTLTSEVPTITKIISTSQPESSQVPQREGKGIFSDEQLKVKAKLVKASTKEDKIKKDAEEAKMFEMTKTEVIKVVQEEAEKIRVDPKIIAIVQLGEKFKKAQDAEHQVLKREQSQKVKRLMELNKKRAEQYMWTISILPTPIPEQAPSQSSGRKKKHMELEPEIKVHGLECNRSLPEGV
ncbi:hypothetical protein Tco_0904843, partial [Tanacetum coccineum]